MLSFFKRKKILPPPLDADHFALGKYGEDKVAEHLKKGGYKILKRNAKYADHEVDIIAADGNTIVFCEVKTRTASKELQAKFGTPADAITKDQKRNLYAAASAFLTQSTVKKWRFDVAEVILKQTDTGYEIETLRYIKDAFRPL